MMYEQGLDSLFLKLTQYNPKKVKGFSDAILIAFRYYKESQTNKNPRDTWRFKGQDSSTTRSDFPALPISQ